MVRLLLKSLFSGGVVTTACLTTFSSNGIPTKENKDLKKVESSLGVITNLDQIELFEKIHGCSFIFVGSWDSKETYKFKKFLEVWKSDDWNQKVIQGANTFKENCKSKKSVALFYSESNKKFALDSSKLAQ